MKKVISIFLMLMCISLCASAARCKAITQKGTQCSRNAVKEGYCTQHYNIHKRNQNHPGYDEKAKACYDANGRPKKAANDAERCHATTKKNTRCKLKAIPGTNYCPTHTK